MRLQLIRHATLWLEYAGEQFLIDPMFSDAGQNPPIVNSTNDRRNPLVPLPFAMNKWLHPDAVIVTHLHRDHWDETTVNILSKTTPIICQPEDDETIISSGFNSVTAVNERFTFKEVTIIRTSGKHGTGDIEKKMGRVSGFVFKGVGQPTLYIAGDTIWCDHVKQVIDEHEPSIIVVNAGGARFAFGDAITMDSDDVVSLCRYAPYARVVAVHMDAINHCLVKRTDLQSRLDSSGLNAQVIIPEDGDWFQDG